MRLTEIAGDAGATKVVGDEGVTKSASTMTGTAQQSAFRLVPPFPPHMTSLKTEELADMQF